MLVSVLLAVYNQGSTVEAAIESIRSQTLEEWELIVVDDGSVDDTFARLARLDDERIKIVRNASNLGLAASLNKAFRLASGTFIARMDADDVALPERLARQVRFLEDHPEIDIVGGAALAMDGGGIILRPERHEDMARRIFKENPFIHPSVMMRRRVLEDLGGYDESLKRAQDYDLWLRGVGSFRYHNLQEPLLEYRRPERPSWKSSRSAAGVVLSHGLRTGKAVRGAFYAARLIAAFVWSRLARRGG